MEASSTQWKGRAVPLREDLRFSTGRGTYINDMKFPDMLHVALLRSVHAHARILRVDLSEALRMPGVVCGLTGEEAGRMSEPLRSLIPIPVQLDAYCLAYGKVTHVGEPVAAILATSRYLAEDALEKIRVEYEPLPAAVDPEAAMEPDAPLLFESMGTNVMWQDRFDYGDVDEAFGRAAHVFKKRFYIQRYSSTALETFGCTAVYDHRREQLTIWSNDQRPGQAMPIVAHSLGLTHAQIRFVTLDVGGGFGNKRKPQYLIIAALLSKMSGGKPVQYLEDRRENLMALIHACNGVMDIEAALDGEGHILGMKVRDIADEGANVLNPTVHSILKLGNLTNCYRIPVVRYEVNSVMTNKCPSGANRGIGKPFMCLAMERMMDYLAGQLGMDRIELRRKNLVPPDAMPYTGPSGALIDSGDFGGTLDKLLPLIDYEAFLQEQQEARAQGRYLGIGIAIGLEPSTSNASAYILSSGRRSASGAAEAAMVRVEHDGSILVLLGDVGSGQGHETAAAQIIADELGVTMDGVRVSPFFDSAVTPWLYATGNYSNKFAGTDVGAILGAARKVRSKLLELAAYLLQEPAENLELAEGCVRSRDRHEHRKTLGELAFVAYRDLLSLPPDMEPGLEGRFYYKPDIANVPDENRRVRNQLFASNAAHGVIVEVDSDTGGITILKYGVVHDCGTVLNPSIVEGLVQGATAHGIGAALYEEFDYDEEGNLKATTFVDYLKPTAVEIPDVRMDHLVTPSPYTPLGMKGVGEGGAIPAPAAICNAVENALEPLGCTFDHLPLTPERVWEEIERARASQRGEP